MSYLELSYSPPKSIQAIVSLMEREKQPMIQLSRHANNSGKIAQICKLLKPMLSLSYSF